MKNSQIFDDVIACNLWFKHPQSKILATPINWRLPEKLFWRPSFFGEHLRLCPWPRPRAFLSLASRGSVLGKTVLGLGLGFFCVLGLGLGLEPSVLDSTTTNLGKDPRKKALHQNSTAFSENFPQLPPCSVGEGLPEPILPTKEGKPSLGRQIVSTAALVTLVSNSSLVQCVKIYWYWFYVLNSDKY